MHLIYSDGSVSLYVGDARRLDAIPDSTVQLIVTSPPYNVGMKYGDVNDRMPWDEYYGLVGAALGEMYRVLRPGGVLAMVLPHYVHDTGGRLEFVYFKVWELVEKAGFIPRQPIIWAKGWPRKGILISPHCKVGSPANPRLRMVHDVILLASKKRLHRQAGPKGGIRRHPWEVMDWLKDVWVIPTAGARGLSLNHPAAFPPEIPARLIWLFTEPGELVLDPFGGSMTTCIVAKHLGRKAIGVDIVEEYVVSAANRLRQMVFEWATVAEISPTMARKNLPLWK